MKKTAMTVAALVLTAWLTPAWAIFESKNELAAMARISMEQAIATALAEVPGKAIEAEIEKEDGRPAFEVKILSSMSDKVRKVHVDAETGKIMKTDKD
jgi:uncharacterized membrane protein YkoI